MAMTVTEKEHFQRRLDERVLELTGDILREDANWQREMVKDAIAVAEQHYGIQDQLVELKKWERRRRYVDHKITTLRQSIVSGMRGMKPEDISENAPQRYGYGQRSVSVVEPFTTDDFRRYPDEAKNIMLSHADAAFKRMFKEHPIGKRLKALRDKAVDFKDRLVACATHAQLQQVWKDITNELNIITAETADRQPRKVETARNAAKTAKGKK